MAMMAVMAMGITAAVAAATREFALPRRCNAMAMCDGDGTRAYAADNVDVGATAEHAHTWAAPWGE